MKIVRFLPNPRLGRGIIAEEHSDHIRVLYEHDFGLLGQATPPRMLHNDALPLCSLEEVEEFDEVLVDMLRHVLHMEAK